MAFKNSEDRRAYSKRWYEENKAKKAAQDKARHALPENKIKGRESSRNDYYRRRDKILAAKRDNYNANKEVILERNRLCRSRNLASFKESSKRSYLKNTPWKSPRAKQQRSKYYRSNKEALTQKAGARRSANPERFKAVKSKAWHKRRAIIQSQQEHFTAEEWLALKVACENHCLRCQRKEPEILLTVDHIIPLCKGGANTIDNIQPLCGQCNCIKGTSTIDYRPAYPSSLRTMSFLKSLYQPGPAELLKMILPRTAAKHSS